VKIRRTNRTVTKYFGTGALLASKIDADDRGKGKREISAAPNVNNVEISSSSHFGSRTVSFSSTYDRNVNNTRKCIILKYNKCEYYSTNTNAVMRGNFANSEVTCRVWSQVNRGRRLTSRRICSANYCLYFFPSRKRHVRRTHPFGRDGGALNICTRFVRLTLELRAVFYARDYRTSVRCTRRC